MAALHPGFRGDVPQSTARHRSKPTRSEAPRVKHEEPRVTEVADARPTAKRSDFKAPQANWTAALGSYRSTGLARAAVHQTPAEPRRGLAAEGSQPSQPAHAFEKTFPTRPAEGTPVGYVEERTQRGSPPVALEGFCPVELGEKGQWVAGNAQVTAVHRGFTYRLSGAEQRRRFLANPERYVPAFSGKDPVLIVDRQRHVRGRTDYCIAYNGHLYMFSGEATLAQFQANPQRYARAW
jgi:YHS domain-containing protein